MSSPSQGANLPFADAHLHSTASDGLLEPSECARELAALGLRGAVLTDHDTLQGFPEFQEAARAHSIQTISGTEISCRWKGRGFHLLAYGLKVENPSVAGLMANQRLLRLERGKRILAAIHRRLRYSLDETILQRPGVICRPHIARQLVECGAVQTMNEAFSRVPELQDEESIPWPQLRSVLALVLKAGGISVAAHPGESLTYANFMHLKTMGLGGIEVWHPAHDENTQRLLRVWTRNLQILATGGSDSHGFINRETGLLETTFGCSGMPEDCWKALLMGINS